MEEPLFPVDLLPWPPEIAFPLQPPQAPTLHLQDLHEEQYLDILSYYQTTATEYQATTTTAIAYFQIKYPHVHVVKNEGNLDPSEHYSTGDAGKLFIRHFVVAEGQNIKQARKAITGTVWRDKGSKHARKEPKTPIKLKKRYKVHKEKILAKHVWNLLSNDGSEVEEFELCHILPYKATPNTSPSAAISSPSPPSASVPSQVGPFEYMSGAPHATIRGDLISKRLFADDIVQMEPPKCNVQSERRGLDIIKELDPIMYNNPNDNNGAWHSGFVPEEIMHVVPEAVIRVNETYTVRPQALISIQTKAIQDISALIDEHNETVHQRIDDLTEQFNTFKVTSTVTANIAVSTSTTSSSSIGDPSDLQKWILDTIANTPSTALALTKINPFSATKQQVQGSIRDLENLAKVKKDANTPPVWYIRNNTQAMPQDPEDASITQYLRARPNSSAIEIARELKKTKQDIQKRLYDMQRGGIVSQDKAVPPRWRVI